MRCEDTKLLLMDFLYEEITDEVEQQLRAHLESCSDCRQEYEELTRTSLMLRTWTDEAPPRNLVFVEPRKSWLNSLKELLYPASAPLWGRLAFGSGVALMTALLVSAILNVELQIGNGQLHYSASLRPRPQNELSATTQTRLAEQLREENQALIKQLVQTQYAEQRAEMNRAFTDFASQLDRKHQTNLSILGQGLEEVQQSTITRLRRHDEVLNQLMRSASFKP